MISEVPTNNVIFFLFAWNKFIAVLFFMLQFNYICHDIEQTILTNLFYQIIAGLL